MHPEKQPATGGLDRRRFLQGTLGAGAVWATSACGLLRKKPERQVVQAAAPPPKAEAMPDGARVRGANETIRVAVCGVRGKGKGHIKQLQEIENVRVVAVVDPDDHIRAERIKEFSSPEAPIEGYRDVRKLLERDDIDAITIATPNHWHSLMSIWACQAGKDVYVEKPCSHNIWEGRKLLEAARKYDRIVQHGTQSRSDNTPNEAFAWLQEGHIGPIQYAHGLCYRLRDAIGKANGPTPIPDHIDYDLWSGPAPLEPLRRVNLHYDWHWVWPTGNGDIGNQGVHEMDLCRWALGQPGLPPRVMSLGGRYVWDDDGTTPNTMISVYDYQPAPLIFEVQNLTRLPGVRAMNNHYGVKVGVVVKCEGGYFAGKHGGSVYDNEGNRIKRFSAGGAENHMRNFIDAVRSHKRADLHAEIAEGHISSALCHMGTVAYQMGSHRPIDKAREMLDGYPDALDTLRRIREHLEVHEIDPAQQPLTVSPWLEFDAQTEMFSGGELYEQANLLVSRDYREPFVIHDEV